MHKLISIIIPCYNCEKWIGQTLDSLIKQTYGYWEIIAVDDGSSDSTLSILQARAERESRIRVFSQPNGGVSVARNNALQMVRGHYIVFIDSDDLLPYRTLEVLLKTIVSHNADIVEGAIVKFTSKLKVNALIDGPGRNVKDMLISGHEAAELSLYQRHIVASMCGKIYKRELFKGVLFPVGEIYEDLSVFYQVALRASRFMVIDGVTYLYRQRSDSQIHTFDSGRLKVLDVTRRIQERVASDPDLLAAAHDRRLSAAFNMLGLLLNDTTLPAPRRRASIMQCRAIIKAFCHQSASNPKVRLKNRIAARMACVLPRPVLEMILKSQYK